MNQWSLQRKRIILAIIFSTLLILVGVPSFFLFYRTPTCVDLKQNGDETGVDCGGSCQLLCTAESLPLIQRGDPRILELGNGLYDVVAVFENSNVSAQILHAGYTLKLFEASSYRPAKIIDSEVFIPHAGPFVVYESQINMGTVHPVRATLEWHTNSFVWQKDTRMNPNIKTKDITLTRLDRTPRVSATLINDSLDRVSNVELTVLISGEDSNLIAASRTFVESLDGSESVPITFNWSEPLRIKEVACGYPVDVGLVMDRSGSMAFLGTNPPQPLTDVKSAVHYFVDQLGGNVLYSLISFANDATTPIDAPLGASLEVIRQAIDNINIIPTSQQNTNIGAGILAAREELNSLHHRDKAEKALVLLTDGVPTLPVKSGVINYPETYALESAELAHQDGISIYSIGLGKDVNMDFLRKLATTTAETYFAPSTNELENIYKQIAVKICKKNPAVIDIYTRVLPNKSYLK